MATAKKMRSAVIALLVLAVVLTTGCSTVGKSNSNKNAVAPTTYVAQSYALATPAPQVVAQPVTTTVIGEFPTSMNKPMGKPWTVMHKDGFTGGYDVACKLLGLSSSQCVTYKEMHSNGSCVTMGVKNGVVLDRLTFTKDGKHLTQSNVHVDLKNPPTRNAEVCDLGSGTVAIRFPFCGNHALVTGWTQPLTIVVTSQLNVPARTVAPVACTASQIMRLNVWGNAALDVPGVRDMIEKTKSSSGYFVPDRVSRSYGRDIRAKNNAGRLDRSTMSHRVTVTHVRGNQETLLYSGTVTGSYDVRMPADLENSDVVKIYFHDHTKLASPLKGDLRGKGSEFVKGTCGAVTNFHAIEN